MSDPDFDRLELFRNILNVCSLDRYCNHSFFNAGSISDWQEMADDGPPWLRILISVVYFVVATAGVLGNLLVMVLLYSTRTVTTGTINFFVLNLALAQLLLSLALPFWAVDALLDYSWPFGLAMCKAVSLLTGLNVYASCFFLTAMSLTRYCFVATALKPSATLCSKSRTFPVATAFIWAAALVAAAPRAIFADLSVIGSANDTTCLLRFPVGTAWLGVNQLLRVLMGFLLPHSIIMVSYLLLLRFLCRHKLKGRNAQRKVDISKSVAVVVLSFCACWFPYNLLSLWGALIQLDLLDISRSFYLAQTYFFPLANCLAFTSSCFNPVIYCLIRKEYRMALHNILLKLTSKLPYGIQSEERAVQANERPIPLNNLYSQSTQSDTKRYDPQLALPTVISSL
ncbi:relaxin-3 receptor 1-like [Synchiropus splendidus]|uniref:relaxin-3 receptor 1-like n=1 Tax=Synchiropus splendidus TaxID=270530 RepID=UPI00237E2968|nr:relaxin-3 receptor 1-like [Synchiropus splendidus]